MCLASFCFVFEPLVILKFIVYSAFWIRFFCIRSAFGSVYTGVDSQNSQIRDLGLVLQIYKNIVQCTLKMYLLFGLFNVGHSPICRRFDRFNGKASFARVTIEKPQFKKATDFCMCEQSNRIAVKTVQNQ